MVCRRLETDRLVISIAVSRKLVSFQVVVKEVGDGNNDCFADCSSTHALKSRTDIVIKGSRLYLKHNTFTEVRTYSDSSSGPSF